MNVCACRVRSVCRAFDKFVGTLTASHYRSSLKHISVPRESYYTPQSNFPSRRGVSTTVVRRMATGAPSTSTDKGGESHHGEPNRLIHERSPYLLQHAYNPVDWYPWGEEAFEKARKENKLIFLSVGYSTCHWCHVMERESFENKDIAKIMNENFVSIKVDREERPDVDKVYMTFIQAISGHGGWPMSVFLTPDLHPVFGGTYYPPNDRYYGQPGFPSILKSLSKQWKENPSKFAASGKQIVSVLEESASVTGGESPPSAESCSTCCFEQLQKSYEPQFGGFSQAPKFPQAVNFDFLLRLYAHPQTDKQVADKALQMVTHTLKMMAKGGIHDHVSTGFARYSTDKKWHVPHFEKMLYDQAQLAVVYADAYVATRDELFAGIVRDILNYVGRDLSDPSGGFYSAEDADSYPEHGAKHKREGAFCVWTFDEVQRILSEPLEEKGSIKLADVLCHHFDIQPKGNVEPYQDPHDELKSQNVLIVRGSEEETAAKFGLDMDVLKGALKRGLGLLYEERQKRPRPHLDDKMIAAWNGLMISGFARAGAVLNDESYIQRAVRAAQFMKEHLYNTSSGRLIRSTYRGSEGSPTQIGKPIDGFLDDYAFTIRGLLDLYEACQDDTWLQWAESLQNKQDELFWDGNAGAYFASPAGDPSILVRQKDDQDGAEPSGNSVSVSNLERLSSILDDASFHDKAGQLVQVFSDRLEKIPIALPEMVSGLMLFEDSPTEVVIAGSKSSSETAALLHEAHVHQQLLAGRVIVLNDPSGESYLSHRRPSITSMKMVGGQATAYVCRQRACSAPVTTADDLRQLLDQ